MTAAPTQWTMEEITLGEPKKKKKRGWFFGSSKSKPKDGWFKNPRDTSWTIDSVVNGKNKPAGYDSNTLITVVRSSQCFSAFMALMFYVCTTSAPAQWLMILAIAAGVLSCGWSMFALFLRHIWSIWLVIPEVLLALAWIVLYGVNCGVKPDESKSESFRVGMIAIEASMVLWLQTCLLAVTPFFHKLVPWLLRKWRSRKARKASKPREVVPGDVELPTQPRAIYTVPPGGDVHISSSAFERDNSLAAPRPPTASPFSRGPASMRKGGAPAPYAVSIETTHGLLQRTHTRDSARNSEGTVSPVSFSDAVQASSPLSTTSHRQVPGELGDRHQRASVNPWDTAAARREEPQWV